MLSHPEHRSVSLSMWHWDDQALPLILLYRQERSQYDLVVHKYPGKSPSEIYGAEHLLRVFGKRVHGCLISYVASRGSMFMGWSFSSSSSLLLVFVAHRTLRHLRSLLISPRRRKGSCLGETSWRRCEALCSTNSPVVCGMQSTLTFRLTSWRD